jgi:hypothetical protein
MQESLFSQLIRKRWMIIVRAQFSRMILSEVLSLSLVQTHRFREPADTCLYCG